MAWTEIKYSCGHIEQIQLYGPHAERERRAAAKEQYDCPACRAAASDLTGSIKQVAWAQDIRTKELPLAEAAYADWSAKVAGSAAPDAAKAHMQAALDAAIAIIRGRTAARDWIDNCSPASEINHALRAAAASAPKG